MLYVVTFCVRGWRFSSQPMQLTSAEQCRAEYIAANPALPAPEIEEAERVRPA